MPGNTNYLASSLLRGFILRLTAKQGTGTSPFPIIICLFEQPPEQFCKNCLDPAPESDIDRFFFNINRVVIVVIYADLLCPHDDLDTLRRIVFA